MLFDDDDDDCLFRYSSILVTNARFGRRSERVRGVRVFKKERYDRLKQKEKQQQMISQIYNR